MDNNRIIYLYRRFVEGTASPEEQQALQSALSDADAEKLLKETWDAEWSRITDDEVNRVSIANYEQVFNHITQQPQKRTRKRYLWPRIAAAAILVISLAAGLFYYYQNKGGEQLAQNVYKNDIAPGSNKAILTLAGGKQIVLTGAKNGLLASQGNTRINKTADGKLVYDASQAPPTGGDLKGATVYNTMTTPRGGQYHLTLADGTNVWLNAASSIKFPTAFLGKDRQVEITGEAYFEVAHNKAKPFRVISNGQTVEVLGTHFNINAYTDEEAIRTTLLEGSVKVTAGKEQEVIAPGQQIQVSLNGKPVHVIAADTEEAVAWKNGLFQFRNAGIQTVMRQVSRWYDVDIKYEGAIPERDFTGKMQRQLNASQVLNLISFTKVHFRIEGKTIIVIP